MRQTLRLQKFAAVVGADLVYENDAQGSLVAHVIRHALPAGGVALLVLAQKYRYGVASFGRCLHEAGFEFEEELLPSWLLWPRRPQTPMSLHIAAALRRRPG